MAYDFRGKRVLLTGAAGDIGSVITIKLVECGAHVLAWDLNNDTLNSLKSKVPSVETMLVDLSNWEETKTAGESCLPVHLLVNCAAAYGLHELGQVTEDSLNRVLAVNVNAAVNLSQVIAMDMKSRKSGGAIVNVSSQMSRLAMKKNLAYCVSKAALDMVTKMFALEFGPHQIRTNAVNPTMVDTANVRKWMEMCPEVTSPMMQRIPLGRIAAKEEVADAVMYLLSDRSSMINGATLAVDGGYSVA